jgi:hypothetical protein
LVVGGGCLLCGVPRGTARVSYAPSLFRQWSSSLTLAVLVFWCCIFSCCFVFTVCLCNAQILLGYLVSV